MNLVQSAAKRVTLKDIAHEAGLSFGAVSLALHDSPKISAETRRRVKAIARKMKYQPNALAVGMASYRKDSKVMPSSSVLAWLNGLPRPEDLRKYREFDLCWRGAEQAAAKFGYRLEEVAFQDSASLQKAEKSLRAREVCGILLPPQPGRLDGWSAINLDGFAVMSLARNIDPPFTHCVTSGQAANAMLAFDRMRAKGYSRIGYVGPLFRTRMFWAGVSWVQNEIPLDRHIPPLFVENKDLSDSREVLSEWISRYRPDAIFTENPGLPQALAEIGVSVPRDIGLAAASVLDEPDIDAGIYQNFEEIGRVAVLSLISLINDRDYGIPEICREILIKGDWVDGASLPDRTRSGSKNRRKR